VLEMGFTSSIISTGRWPKCDKNVKISHRRRVEFHRNRLSDARITD